MARPVVIPDRYDYLVDPELEGRQIVILGSGPLALAITSAFLQNRAPVRLIEPDELRAGRSELDEVRSYAPGLDKRLLEVSQADFADRESLGKALACIPSPVHTLVCCVDAAPGRRAVTEITDLEWRRSLDGILGSAYHAACAVVPGMIEAGEGRIVLVSSLHALNPPWSSSAEYAAAKGGLLGLARHMSKELGHQGIRTNAVVPGATRREWDAIVGTDLEDAALEAIPAGRLSEPSEPASLVLFLAGRGAVYINGATLHCSGGRSM
jgi:3-oxoacyl-[acyl-carrier protein] reductase